MASTFSKIPQTHRAILFESFSDQTDLAANNLNDLLATDEESDLYKDIQEKLEVKSFEEFLKKFPLTVYEYATASDDGGMPSLHYTTSTEIAKNFPQRNEIKLTDHSYFEMLVDMYTKKGASGVADIEFKDAKIREILTPKREIEKIYDLRRQIPLLMEKKEQLIKKNENPVAVDKKLKEIRRSAIEQIKSPASLMAVALADTQQKIEMVDNGIKQLSAPSDGVDNVETKLLSGSVGFDDDGRLTLIPAKTADVNSDESTDSPTNPGYLQLMSGRIGKDLDKYAADTNNFTKALVISAYTGVDVQSKNPLENTNRTELEVYRAQLTDKKNTLEKVFAQSKEEFVKELSKLVQKVLGVKIFFDHATVKGGDISTLPKSGLIVTNCKASKLLGSSVRDKFIDCMKRLGTVETDEKKLWFAILPQVAEDETALADFDDDDDELYEQNADESGKSSDNVDFETAKDLLKVMEECKIMTVFNFAPTPETTFSKITQQKIESLKNKLQAVKSAHAVFAFPNFTIMKDGSVPLSDLPDAPKIKVPAVYVDASYVAAGLLVAAQQIDFWTARGYKNGVSILTSNACVRVDLEGNAAVRTLLTKFNRERFVDWSPEIDAELTKDRFGFAFGGKRIFDPQSDKPIDNTYILNARTLNQVEGEYQPIFATLTKDFIETYWRTYKGTPEDLKSFTTKIIPEWFRQAAGYVDKNIVNLLLKDGESITYNKDDKKIDINLRSGEKILDISFGVEIKD